MLKDAFEDYKRNTSDSEENMRATQVLSNNTMKHVVWQDLKPGQLIKIEEDEPIPCDCVLLGSSDPKGCIYIETKNLDGETNLKNKFVHKEINARFVDSPNNQEM